MPMDLNNECPFCGAGTFMSVRGLNHLTFDCLTFDCLTSVWPPTGEVQRSNRCYAGQLERVRVAVTVLATAVTDKEVEPSRLLELLAVLVELVKKLEKNVATG